MKAFIQTLMKAVGTLFSALLCIVIVVAIWSFVAVFLWDEFRGAFGWPSLSYWQMFCLGLFVDMLLPHSKNPSQK